MNAPVRVGLIDGTVAVPQATSVVAARRFHGDAASVDAHAGMVAQSVLAHCPEAALVSAEVFDMRRTAPVEAIIDAIDWLIAQQVSLINMSFGIARDVSALRAACERATAHDCLLVAAAPSHGPTTYPAGFGACIAVTGDARCQPGEIALLGTAKADFGTHPFVHAGQPQHGGGASIATARMTGLIADMVRRGVSIAHVEAALVARAAYVGPEVIGA